jgi:arsenate reductase-like glutaredoxin family protein
MNSCEFEHEFDEFEEGEDISEMTDDELVQLINEMLPDVEEFIDAAEDFVNAADEFLDTLDLDDEIAEAGLELYKQTVIDVFKRLCRKEEVHEWNDDED